MICFFQSVQHVPSIWQLPFACDGSLHLTVRKRQGKAFFQVWTLVEQRLFEKWLKTIFMQAPLILKSGRSGRSVHRKMTHDTKTGQKDSDKAWSHSRPFHQRCYRPHLATATTLSDRLRKVWTSHLAWWTVIIPRLLRQVHNWGAWFNHTEKPLEKIK